MRHPPASTDPSAPVLAPPLDAAAAVGPPVVLCIATYRRPRQLAMLLESLRQQVFTGAVPRLQFVVVDNDVNRSAASVVQKLGQRMGGPVHYFVEAVQSIALARNRSVSEALGLGAEWLAFIDDDEVADPRWLDRLLRGQEASGAPVVSGRVVPSFPASAPVWVREGSFFGSPPPSSLRLHLPSTCNVLVAASLLKDVDRAFDSRFGLTGGSDMLFFLRLHYQGIRTAWAPEAVVRDNVPESRACLSWILQRSFRYGNVSVRCERALWGNGGRPASRLAKAAGRLFWGLASLPVSLLRGRAALVRALCNVSYGVGATAAAVGFQYEEYRFFNGE